MQGYIRRFGSERRRNARLCTGRIVEEQHEGLAHAMTGVEVS